MKKIILFVFAVFAILLSFLCIYLKNNTADVSKNYNITETVKYESKNVNYHNSVKNIPVTDKKSDYIEKKENDTVIYWNSNWKYASFSEIHKSSVKLYKSKANRKNKIICVNAGHGTAGGSRKRTYCHPDKSPKVTGGSTKAGSIKATSINEGTALADGTKEADANLSLALILKNILLENGYDVLMIRETDNTYLDNIARTVFANNNADCHISVHYDGTETNKGFFYISVPNNQKYRNMEPVRTMWKEHNRLGKCIFDGVKSIGIKTLKNETISVDLTQTSYSTVPSVDLEVGDKRTDHSPEYQTKTAFGILKGLDYYFYKNLNIK